MTEKTLNPYKGLTTILTGGMDRVAQQLTIQSTVDDLVDEVYGYIQPIFYNVTPVPEQLKIQIKSVAYNVINAYNNGMLRSGLIEYNTSQMNFCSMMIGYNTTVLSPVNAMRSWIEDIEDNITKADFIISEQTPLLLGTLTGTELYDYWDTKVSTPGDWSTFFQTNSSENYANIPHWTSAGMEGALIGANTSPLGLISPDTELISTDIVSAIIGAITVGAGKVIFKWIPRIQPITVSTGLPLSAIRVYGASGTGFGGTGDGDDWAPARDTRRNPINKGAGDIKYKKDEINKTRDEHNNSGPTYGGRDYWVNIP